MKTLKLEVGKTYRNRKGEEIKIIGKNNKCLYPYQGDNGYWYKESGKWDNSCTGHPEDLVAEVTISDANQNTTAKMKTLKLQVGKTYRSREGEKVKIVRMGNMGGDYWSGNNGEWYHEGGKWSHFAEEHPKDLIAEVETTRRTFAIPDGMRIITVEQIGDRIIIEMMPEKKPKPGDVMINNWGSIYIFKAFIGDYNHKYYVWLGKNGHLAFESSESSCPPGHLATPEEAQPLWDALKKAGKRWNAETMEIEDVPEIDHICKWVEKHLDYRYYNHESLTKVIYNYLKYKESEK